MEEFTISEIQILPVRPKNGLISFASLVLNNNLYIGNIAVYTRPNNCGYRLVYPSRTLPNGKRLNVVCPITADLGYAMERAIQGKHEEILKKCGFRNTNDQGLI